MGRRRIPQPPVSVCNGRESRGLRGNSGHLNCSTAGEVDFAGDHTIKPFRQGNLDAFCGIYSLINAVNFAAKFPVIDHGTARVVFRELSTIAMGLRTDKEQPFYGLSGYHLRHLANAMISGLAEANIHVQLKTLRQAFPRFDIAKTRKSRWFKTALDTPNIALILRINTKLISHWSVLRAYEGTRIDLFDSVGIDECANRSCTIWGVVIHTEITQSI